jgi:hypothetical protein
MTWYAVIDKATGELFSLGTLVADRLPAEFDAIPLSIVEAPDWTLVQWNASTRAFEALPKKRSAVDEILAQPEILPLGLVTQDAIRTAAQRVLYGG